MSAEISGTADIVWVMGKETPVTRLRKMMLEELQRRNYSEITTRKSQAKVKDETKTVLDIDRPSHGRRLHSQLNPSPHYVSRRRSVAIRAGRRRPHPRALEGAGGTGEWTISRVVRYGTSPSVHPRVITEACHY